MAKINKKLLMLTTMLCILMTHAPSYADVDAGIEDYPDAEQVREMIDDDDRQIRVQPSDDGTLIYTYQVQNDIELRGIQGENQWYFNVDEELEVVSFDFRLFLRMSEAIRSETSYFTVYVNDIPLETRMLKTGDDVVTDSWEFVIPADKITKGYNELAVRTHSRVMDTCEDDRNIANWVTIDGRTGYEIRYAKRHVDYLLSDFPRPFVGLYADDAKGIAVVIPDDYTAEEASAALNFMAYLKSSNLAYEVPVTFLVGESTLPEYDSIVYVGRFERIPQLLTGAIDLQTITNRNTAHLVSGVSDQQQPTLLIVSDDGVRLQDGVRALYNEELKAQMTSRYIPIPADIETKVEAEPEDDYLYLSDLGIGWVKLHGSNQQAANIGLRIPSNYQLANEARVNLRLRYSDNLDFEKSMVTVYVNGEPIGSHRLERHNRDYHNVDFYLPEKVRGAYYYDIRVVFDLIPSGIIDCERYLQSAPWVYINEDSNFYFPRVKRNFISLDYLPSPFQEDGNSASAVIALPDQPNSDDYRVAGMIAQMLGVGAKGNQGTLHLVKGSDLKEEHYQNHVILWGSAADNTAIDNFNKYLWFRYNDTFDKFLMNEKMELLDETAATATIFELKLSPFAAGKSVLSITSPNRTSLLDATEYLTMNQWTTMTGDAAVISKEGDVTNLRFQKDVIERPNFAKSGSITGSMKQYLLFFAILVLFLMISLGLYVYKNRKNQ